jgi:ribonuclease P protein component
MFKQVNRLTSKFEINSTKRAGTKLNGRYFICLYLRQPENKKFTVIVSTRFDKKAVVRNKVKRQIRQAVTTGIKSLPTGFYLFIPKKHIVNAKYEEISTDINQVLSRYFKF